MSDDKYLLPLAASNDPQQQKERYARINETLGTRA
jgi:hypothetical protein